MSGALSKHEIDQFVSLLEDLAKEITINAVDFDNLVSQAIQFKNNYNRAERIYQQSRVADIRSLLASSSLLTGEKPNPIIHKLVTNMSQDKTNHNYYQYLLVLRFEEYLDKFLENAPRELAVVQKSGDTLKTYTFPLRDMVVFMSGMGISKIDQALSTLQKEDQLEKTIEEKHLLMAAAAYTGSFNRLKTFREMTKTKGRKDGYIIYRSTNDYAKWNKYYVNGDSDLKEAYVAVLRTQHKAKYDILCNKYGSNPGNYPMYGHSFIHDFLVNYVNNVTNMGALKEEDVLVKEIGNNNVEKIVVQDAVKGEGGTFPGFDQYIKIADFIIENKDNTSNKIKQLIRDKIDNIVSDGIRNQLDNELSKMMGIVDRKDVLEVINKINLNIL